MTVPLLPVQIFFLFEITDSLLIIKISKKKNRDLPNQVRIISRFHISRSYRMILHDIVDYDSFRLIKRILTGWPINKFLSLLIYKKNPFFFSFFVWVLYSLRLVFQFLIEFIWKPFTKICNSTEYLCFKHVIYSSNILL